MIQWEYKSRWLVYDVMPGSESELKMLLDYGADRWELCAVYKDNNGRVYYFKRQITKP